MVQPKSFLSKLFSGTLFLVFCMVPSLHPAWAQFDTVTGTSPLYSPVVNGEALRGLSTINSAESMGAGRITFDVMVPWYRQQTGFMNTPITGANVFTGAGAFSYGVNSYVDLFASIAGFGLSNNISTDRNSGLGTMRAGAQGSVPFAQSAFVRMGGQASILGGTSDNQINTYRADGYNYFETRTGYSFMGKLMQTFLSGSEDWGMKLHLNEATVLGVNKSDHPLLLLGAGLQANTGFVVLGAEINSRTRFSDLAFGTDPLWCTPSIHLRTPYQMNAMAGVDISLSADRSNGAPRALEPYRIFGSVAFSFDMLAGKRNAEFVKKQKEAQEKAALEAKAATAANQVKSLTIKSINDSVALANEKESGQNQMDSMQTEAAFVAQENQAATDALAKKSYADSLSLIQAANNLAIEKGKRSEAEKQLLSTGELLLDAVYFETGKAVISINSKPYLNIIGKMLLKYPKLQIEVAGHTDNVGGAEYNIGLSQNRAQTVRDYLTSVSPALSSGLSAHGYGMSIPKADNGTKEGRLTNRRVELRVTNKGALQDYSLK